MTHEDYQKAANHWKAIDATAKKMPEDLLLKACQDYLGKNNTCALATGSDSFVRCTPIEYTYHDGAFWLFSEGGEKFISLEKNPNVCLAIFDKYDGFGTLKGMQVMGVASVVEPFSSDYLAAADYKKIPVAALKKLPEVMNLIKIVPTRIDFLNTDFKRDGYSSRQELKLH